MKTTLRQEETLIDYENLELEDNMVGNLLGNNSIGSNLTGQSHYMSLGMQDVTQDQQR